MNKSFFDHFKDAFELSKDKKYLYIPNLLFSLVPVLLIPIFLFLGFTGGFKFSPITIFVLSISIVAYFILTLFVRSGVLHMKMRSIVYKKEAHFKDFINGLTEYPLDLLIGYALLFVAGILIFLPVGIVALSINTHRALGAIGIFSLLSVIALIAFIIFVSFWEIILVFEGDTPFEAIKSSFKFVKNNFWYAFFIILIEGIVNNNPGSRGNNSNNDLMPFSNLNFSNLANYTLNSIITSFATGATIIAIVGIIVGSILQTFMDLVKMNFYYNVQTPISDDDEELLEEY